LGVLISCPGKGLLINYSTLLTLSFSHAKGNIYIYIYKTFSYPGRIQGGHIENILFVGKRTKTLREMNNEINSISLHPKG
jgi:hypothetical protein